MPEGPEVEFTRQTLKRFVGMNIKKIELTNLSQKYNKYKEKQLDFKEFSNRKLKQLERRGKFLIWIFDCQKVILNHLGMSGKWLIFQKHEYETKVTHPKVILKFEKINDVAVFDDPRNFGQFRVFDSYSAVIDYPPIKKLGPNGLEIPFPEKRFKTLLLQKKYEEKEIGQVLLDQRLLAGIGNIYKSESLALAKISPLRLVKNLSAEDIKILGQSISITLNKAVESMGSTIQSFRTPYGDEGSAQNWHKVYGRQGQKCKDCGTQIERILQNKRSTFYCKRCQI